MKNIIKICETGGKQVENRIVNEDIVGNGDGFCFLMDGATGLGKLKFIDGLTPAEWFVKTVAVFLQKELKEKDKDIKQIVSEAIEYVTSKIRKYEKENNLTFASHEEPSACLLICREIEKKEQKYIQIYALRRCRCCYNI